MDKETFRIAVASSDGIVVNQHFGKSRLFFIYTVDEEEGIRLLERREVTPVCEGGNHDDERLRENLEKLKDCHYLCVARIGDGAARAAEEYNIESFEIPGIIEESIEQLIKYIKIQKLFALERTVE